VIQGVSAFCGELEKKYHDPEKMYCKRLRFEAILVLLYFWTRSLTNSQISTTCTLLQSTNVAVSANDSWNKLCWTQIKMVRNLSSAPLLLVDVCM
jgi:hypothetical protein